MATDISICSQALLRLGEKTISSFNDESDRATVCANTWPELKRSILGVYPWKRTMRKARLNRATSPPANEYEHAYNMPTDRLLDVPHEVWNGFTSAASSVNDFKIFDNQLLTDCEEVAIDYQVEISEGDFSPHLIELSTLALAAEIAIPITQLASFAEYFRTAAWGNPSENGQGGYYRTARNKDAAGEPPNVVDDYSLVFVRQEGTRA